MTAIDPRLTRARDALETAALHPVEALPPSVMLRELAELRQALAGLVALAGEYPGTPSGEAGAIVVELDDGQRETLAAMAADALDWRCPDGFCRDCESSGERRCDEHAADDSLCRAYVLLARELGVEVKDR